VDTANSIASHQATHTWDENISQETLEITGGCGLQLHHLWVLADEIERDTPVTDDSFVINRDIVATHFPNKSAS